MDKCCSKIEIEITGSREELSELNSNISEIEFRVFLYVLLNIKEKRMRELKLMHVIYVCFVRFMESFSDDEYTYIAN